MTGAQTWFSATNRLDHEMPYNVDVPDAEPGSGFDVSPAAFATENEALFHAYCVAEHFHTRGDAPEIRLVEPSGLYRELAFADLRMRVNQGQFGKLC